MSEREYDRAAVASPIVLQSESTRDKLTEIIARLEAGIKDIFQSDKYKDYLKTLAKFHNYSFNNCVLIALQKPDATYVAGFSAWKKNFKRHVLKDEKGIKILAPSPYKILADKEKIDPQSGRALIGSDGKPVTEKAEVVIPAFKVVSVFDVSQTDGKPLPEIGVDELAGDVETYKDFFAALEKTSPVPITFEDITGGAKGYFEQTTKRIAIQEGMGELQTLKTAIHEIAHARLHDIDKNAPKDVIRPDRDTREVEAESVAYAVCSHYGLDTADYSFAYIAGWSGEKELDTLKASLDTIRSEANAIIAEAGEHMAVLQKEREQTHVSLVQNIAAYAPTPARESPLKTAEMSTEQNLNMVDGVLNNQPTVAELQARAEGGEQISLSALATAIKYEREGERISKDAPKPSIRERLQQGKKQLAKEGKHEPVRAAINIEREARE